MQVTKAFSILLVVIVSHPVFALEITSLSCSGQKNPLGLDEAPSFSWVMASDKRGVTQSSYQLQIASSLETLERDEADLFDSQKKQTDQSIHIKPKLASLSSGTRYFWRVRVWDSEGETSEWSAPAWFETGLLNDSDWSGQWISAPPLFDWQAVDSRRKKIAKDAPPELPEPAPLFRKEFNVSKRIKRARAYISGLGYHELYLNGVKIGDHLLDPAFTRYDKRALYVTHDITAALRQGGNALGVMLGNGWYDLSSRGVWGYDYAAWRDRPALLCQIKITFEDGSDTLVVSNDSWTCSPGPIIFNSIRQGEWYDARLEKSGWNVPDYDEKSWFPVRVVRGPEGVLSAQNLPPVRVHSSFKPKSINQINPGHFLVDFGQNMAGFVELYASGEKGQELTITYAEKIIDGRIDQSNIDGLVASTPFQTDKYILKGEGVENWHARFTYHGFQYVEIEGFPGELTAEHVTAFALSTAFEQQSTFECSNDLINQIQHNTLWSYRNNFVGYPTDCPQREKNGWTGDAQLAAETGLFNFASASAYQKWLRDIADEQQDSGAIAAIIPTAGWGYYWGNGPAWDSAFLLIPYYLYLYTGDTSTIAEHYDQMKRYVDFLTREKSQNGLVSWGLGDWCHEKSETPAQMTSTGYYFIDVKLMSLFADLLGKKAEKRYYSDLAQKIQSAFLHKFVDEGAGRVGNSSQTALSCALYQELVETEKAEKIVESLIQNIVDNGNKLDFGILGAKYTLNSLSRFGFSDVAYQLINHTAYPGWGHWIARGATTLWEDWKGVSSRNHIMFGDVSAWFYKNITGIQPDPEQPGFKHFYVRPFFPPDMEWAKATVTSPYGPIKSHWQRQSEKVRLELVVPVNTRATVELPFSEPERVRFCENEQGGVQFQGSINGKIVYNLKSGSYCLEF